MKHFSLTFASVLLLAGCDQSPRVDEKDASVEEVAREVREAGADQSLIRPGLWESKVTIEQFDVPGMPPEMADRMKTMMAEQQEHGFETCLTAEDVKRPKEDFFAGKNNACRYENFTMGGGKVDAVMHCGKGDATQTMQMAGTYSPDAYQMQTKMQQTGGQGALSMTMRIEANRIGECAAKRS